jgi:hypothetical protein
MWKPKLKAWLRELAWTVVMGIGRIWPFNAHGPLGDWYFNSVLAIVHNWANRS